MYYKGKSIPVNRAEAAKWFLAAAEQNIPEAQNLLAVMYYTGDGVPLSYAEAARWARRAAEQGLPSGQADLGFLYEHGKGVPLDYSAAYAWYLLASAGGEHRSKERLKSLERIMVPQQLHAASALASEWASNRGRRIEGNYPRSAMSYSLKGKSWNSKP
jgi:TPR repeat protein